MCRQDTGHSAASRTRVQARAPERMYAGEAFRIRFRFNMNPKPMGHQVEGPCAPR